MSPPCATIGWDFLTPMSLTQASHAVAATLSHMQAKPRLARTAPASCGHVWKRPAYVLRYLAHGGPLSA